MYADKYKPTLSWSEQVSIAHPQKYYFRVGGRQRTFPNKE